jgi:hypothetical protein
MGAFAQLVLCMDIKKSTENSCDGGSAIRIFLCGDVMTGRGIDQILPYPSDPVIHEPY